MSGEFVEENSAEFVVRIPGVSGGDRFVEAGGQLLSAEAVMFDIVDGFEEEGADEGGGDGEGEEGTAGEEANPQEPAQLDEAELNHFVG